MSDLSIVFAFAVLFLIVVGCLAWWLLDDPTGPSLEEQAQEVGRAIADLRNVIEKELTPPVRKMVKALNQMVEALGDRR